MVKLFGKPIRINKASQDKNSNDVGANLFIGNLDPEVDEKVCMAAVPACKFMALSAHFSSSGTITPSNNRAFAVSSAARIILLTTSSCQQTLLSNFCYFSTLSSYSLPHCVGCLTIWRCVAACECSYCMTPSLPLVLLSTPPRSCGILTLATARALGLSALTALKLVMQQLRQ
eukprot:GHRR01036145.1.p1 GENE.GHRR01036145.1~~GHRR01036145.1.p1  ORF type:complete len:173 (-),score=31.77 GHRR01036145.1:17-535(-)